MAGIMRFLISLLAMVYLAGCSVYQPPAQVVNGWQNPSEGSNYKVQPDDTIYSIAWAYGMDYRDIARYNHLSAPYALHTGQWLQMSGSATPKAESAKTPTIIPVAPAKPFVENPPPTVVATKPVAAKKSSPAAQPQQAAALSPATVKWLWPTNGRILRGFSSAAGGNRGLDIGGKLGQPIWATAAGKVVYSGSNMKGYGNLIIIKHTDNELSAYAFNKTVAVKEGETVKAGQQIATMGKNDAGQVLLHFEIRRNGKPIDPKLNLK